MQPGAVADSGDAGRATQAPFEVEAFFDGDCPLCVREMAALRRLDRGGRIRFTNLADPGFDPQRTGRTFQELMDRIHARLPDGTVIEGVEVFRRLYTIVGFAPLVALTRLPGISQLLDVCYRVFARNRLRLTGRCRDAECRVHAPAPSPAARRP
jgi:predicted DCC family thiol-disulfide oxidoreductase YuxK